MPEPVRVLLFVLFGIAFFTVWAWGLLSFVSGKRKETERSLLGSKLSVMRSGPLVGVRWGPSADPLFPSTVPVASMTRSDEKLLTILGDSILNAGGNRENESPQRLFDALRTDQHDDYQLLGAMTGLTREEVTSAVTDLVAEGYLRIERNRTGAWRRIALTDNGATWYLKEVLAIDWTT